MTYLCKPVRNALISILLLATLAGCNTEYQRVLKSTDQDFKYQKALEYYENEQFFKAIPIFEELMSLGKGTQSMEDIYYYYCMAQYGQRNYIIAAYHFKEYVQRFPFDDRAEEALFLHAECYEKQSPGVSLDQTNTIKAIEAYQTFINAYPDGDRVAETNDRIEALRDKLEAKALRAADLYYRTKNYRAAAISYRNLLIDYPDIENAEEIQFKIVFSYDRYADLSVLSKQSERYADVISAGDDFLSRYPDSERAGEVQDLIDRSHYRVIESALDYARTLPPAERPAQLEEVRNLYTVHVESLGPARSAQADELYEASVFEDVQAWFDVAQAETERTEKIDAYQHTVDAYYDYNTRYADGEHQKDARKLYDSAVKNLNKMDQNG